MGSMPWPPPWPPRPTSSWRRSIPRLTRRCCACFSRGARTWSPNVPERSRQLARASTRPPPRRDSRNALGQPGCTHPARHTAAGHLGPPQTAIGFGGAAFRIRTLDRKIADLNGLIEAEVEASGTTLMRLQDRFRVTGYSNAHENSDLCTSGIRRGARTPPKGSALQRHFHHAPIADAPQMLLASSRGERAPKIALNLGCASQTVRDAIHDFDGRGLLALQAKSSRPKRTRDAFDRKSA